jgi:hypothetical protein
MPIEIRELHIKAVIESGKTGGTGSGGATGQTTSASAPAQGQDELIEICVEKVLEILKQKTER